MPASDAPPPGRSSPPRLRRADCSSAGIARIRRGRGFSYRDAAGVAVDRATRARIEALVIPPAWEDVWICADDRGHIQATGIDARGRKQYLYHEAWRAGRDRRKFAAMEDFARALPALRRTVTRDLRRPDLDERRVLACAVRLLDVGFFRIGGRAYAQDNDSYGLTTLKREHVEAVRGDEIVFDYTAKGGIDRHQLVRDPQVAAVVARLRRRRTGDPSLFVWKDGRAWRGIDAGDVNAYLKAHANADASAKVFRTWQATVLAAVAVAVSGPVAGTKAGRTRAKRRAAEEVAHYLGNTPTIARGSYIDPRVFDRYDGGLTIGGALEHLAGDGAGIIATHGAAEAAVLDLLDYDRSSPALQRTSEWR
jgi:DNA topoisomerase-1